MCLTRAMRNDAVPDGVLYAGKISSHIYRPCFVFCSCPERVQQSTGQDARKQTKRGQGPHIASIPRRSLENRDPFVIAVTMVVSVVTPDDSA